jgi:hypothetical protein
LKLRLKKRFTEISINLHEYRQSNIGKGKHMGFFSGIIKIDSISIASQAGYRGDTKVFQPCIVGS